MNEREMDGEIEEKRGRAVCHVLDSSKLLRQPTAVLLRPCNVPLA